MRKVRRTVRVFLGVVLAIWATLLLALPSAEANSGQNGTTLIAEVSATGNWTRTYGWTIDKSVTPSAFNLFRGDTGTSVYAVSVNRDNGNDAASFGGTAYVYNGGAVATEGLAIAVQLTMPPSQVVLATVNVDLSAQSSLAPYTGYSYPFSISVPAGSIVPGATYKVTANVTIVNHSGSLGTNFGPSPSASGLLPGIQTTVNESVQVDDSFGPSWQFGGSGSQSYSRTFGHSDAGVQNNTATIRETGQAASAAVVINAYELDITATADTSLTRTYAWTIGKSGGQSNLTLASGQQYAVGYAVTVGGSYADSDWTARGTIALSNPAPIAATIVNVADVLSGGIAASVDCGDAFPLVLAAGETMVCDYSAGLPDASSRTNTTTAVLQNHNYSSALSASALGTTAYTASGTSSFGTATMNEVDKCVAVTDSLQGNLGEVCFGADTLPKAFVYTRDVGPYSSSGNYAVNNTATYSAETTGTSASASWVVNVIVPGSGCTLTIGYWKTHAGFGPQPDMVSELLPIWLGTTDGSKSILVSTASDAVKVLDMKFYGTRSNGVTKLYAQLLGAKLNIAAGGDAAAVASVIGNADAFLTTKNWRDWTKLTKSQKSSVLSWMTALDRFNNGITGPGHCSL